MEVGRRELLSFAERHAKAKVSGFADLASGEVFCRLFNLVFPEVRLQPAHRDTNSASQIAHHNWTQVAKAAKHLGIPAAILDRSTITGRGKPAHAKACVSALVLFYFLHALCKDGDCTIQFSVDLTKDLAEFVQSPASVRALVVGGAMPLDKVPQHIRAAMGPVTDPALERRAKAMEHATASAHSEGTVASSSGMTTTVPRGLPPKTPTETPRTARLREASPPAPSRHEGSADDDEIVDRDFETPGQHGGERRRPSAAPVHGRYADDDHDTFDMDESEEEDAAFPPPAREARRTQPLVESGSQGLAAVRAQQQAHSDARDAAAREMLDELEAMHGELEKQIREKAALRAELAETRDEVGELEARLVGELEQQTKRADAEARSAASAKSARAALEEDVRASEKRLADAESAHRQERRVWEQREAELVAEIGTLVEHSVKLERSMSADHATIGRPSEEAGGGHSTGRSRSARHHHGAESVTPTRNTDRFLPDGPESPILSPLGTSGCSPAPEDPAVWTGRGRGHHHVPAAPPSGGDRTCTVEPTKNNASPPSRQFADDGNTFQATAASLRRLLVDLRAAVVATSEDREAEAACGELFAAVDQRLWILIRRNADVTGQLESAECRLQDDVDTLAALRKRSRNAEERAAIAEAALQHATENAGTLQTVSGAASQARRARSELADFDSSAAARHLAKVREAHAGDLAAMSAEYTQRVGTLQARERALEDAVALRDDLVAVQRRLLTASSALDETERSQLHARARDLWNRSQTDLGGIASGTASRTGTDTTHTDLAAGFRAVMERCVRQRDAAIDDAAATNAKLHDAMTTMSASHGTVEPHDDDNELPPPSFGMTLSSPPRHRHYHH